MLHAYMPDCQMDVLKLAHASPLKVPGLKAANHTPLCRLRDGTERPSPQAVGMMVQALGRLDFKPPCQWDTQQGQFVNVLDGLFTVLVDELPQASPQVMSAESKALRDAGQGRSARLCSTCFVSPWICFVSSHSVSPPPLQDICACLSGLGLLAYVPQPVALCKLLGHVSAAACCLPSSCYMT